MRENRPVGNSQVDARVKVLRRCYASSPLVTFRDPITCCSVTRRAPPRDHKDQSTERVCLPAPCRTGAPVTSPARGDLLAALEDLERLDPALNAVCAVIAAPE